MTELRSPEPNVEAIDAADATDLIEITDRLVAIQDTLDRIEDRLADRFPIVAAAPRDEE